MSQKMSEEEKLEEWKESARKMQQWFYNVFGDRSWDVYQPSERHLLEKNIGYALYGPPEAMPNEENKETGYCKNKLKHIRNICDAVVKYDQHDRASDETWVAMLFVCLNENGSCFPVPVFRVPKYNPKGDSSIYIDNTGRVYEGWNNFLTNNCLNKCKYCYPVDGLYFGDENYNVQLEFGDTPACKISRKVLDVLDTTSTCVAVGGTVVGLASLTALPIAAPIVAASIVSNAVTYLYSTTRSVGTLVDKKKHHQSISLRDSEARCCYLSVVAGALGMASGIGSRWVARLVQNGELVSKTGRAVVTALNISSLATNGAGIVNNFFLLRQKHKSGDLSCLDVFQFTSSVLFFTNAVVNVKTASTIIKETQDSTLKNFEESLAFKKHKKLYRRMAKTTIADADDPIYGKASVIKAMLHIENPEDFFSNINKVRRELHETKTEISFGKPGSLKLNSDVQVDPLKFSKVGRDQRRAFLTATKGLNEGTITNTELTNLAEQNSVAVELPSNSCGTSAAERDEKNSLTLSGIIEVAEAHAQSLLKSALSLERADYQLLLSYAERLCNETGFHKAADVLNVLNFIIDFINDVANSMEEQYQQDVRQMRELHHERFDQRRFDEGYMVLENRMRIFSVAIMKSLDKLYIIMKRVYELFTREEELEENLIEECSNLVFENIPNTISVVPEDIAVEPVVPCQEGQSGLTCQKLETISEQEFPYSRERNFSLEGNVSDLELHEIASFLTDMPVCETNSELFRDGNIAFITANPPSLFNCVVVASHVFDNMVTAFMVS